VENGRGRLTDAQFNPGSYYSVGKDVGADHMQARKWFGYAAEQVHVGDFGGSAGERRISTVGVHGRDRSLGPVGCGLGAYHI